MLKAYFWSTTTTHTIQMWYIIKSQNNFMNLIQGVCSNPKKKQTENPGALLSMALDLRKGILDP